jgi:hypothetical protein
MRQISTPQVATSVRYGHTVAEELDAQAATLKDQVAKLRQLVGGESVTASASPAPRPSPSEDAPGHHRPSRDSDARRFR